LFTQRNYTNKTRRKISSTIGTGVLTAETGKCAPMIATLPSRRFYLYCKIHSDMFAKLTIGVIAGVGILMIASCKKTDPICDGSQATYETAIKYIIDKSCISCHGGASSRNFTTYQGLKPWLDNGKFKKLVLDEQTMPKGPAKLSQDELNKIQCWVENGYPEK
jgi:hypothetical protein